MVDRRWIVTLGLVSGLLGASCQRHPPPAGAVETVEAVIAGERFTLELALDKDARFTGLSDRSDLAANAGMLFVFLDPVRTEFVMRRCRFPIDLVFVGPGGRVDRMHRMAVEPYDTPEDELRRYPCSGRVQFAIEFVGGTLDRLGLELGQKLDLPWQDLKHRAR